MIVAFSREPSQETRGQDFLAAGRGGTGSKHDGGTPKVLVRGGGAFYPQNPFWAFPREKISEKKKGRGERPPISWECIRGKS